MYVRNLGTIAPTLTLTNFYASLLTKSNMAAVGHFGKVLFFVTYSYIVNDFGTHNSFLMLFSSLGLIFHAYLRSKSNMADVGHVGKVIFFVPCTIFTCNTSIVTNCGMQNSFLMLLSSLGSISLLIYLQIQYGGRRPYWKSHLL